jgi:hypothetical protein
MPDAPLSDPRGRAVPGAEIVVRVTPNAARAQVTLDGRRFVIRVTCVPEDGKANKAVTRLLAKALGVAPSRLVLIRGTAGRDEVFRVECGGKAGQGMQSSNPSRTPFRLLIADRPPASLQPEHHRW